LSKTRAIIKDAAKFTVSGYISSVCNFVSAVVIRKILDPFVMGVYTELMLILDYAKYSHLGVFDSLDRQIPYYSGKSDTAGAEEAKNTGGTFSLLTSILCALAIIAYSFFRKEPSGQLFGLGLKVAAIMVVAQSMGTFYVTIIRANMLFGALSRYMVIIAVADIILKASLGFRFGMIGILWASVMTSVFGVVYLFRKTGIKFKFLKRLPRQVLTTLLKIGFPLLLTGFGFTVLRSMDRIIIISFLTKEELGLYSIAIMVYSFVFQLPNLIYTVLFPRFYKAFGDTENIDELKGFIEKPTMVFAYLFPILIGIGSILLPVFVRLVLPKYNQGAGAATILLFGTFFMSITNMSGYLLVALKKQNSMVLITAVSIAANAALNIFFVAVLKMGITGIAIGTSISYFIYSVLLIGYAMDQYVRDMAERAKFYANAYLPVFWMAIVSFLIIPSAIRAFKGGLSDTASLILQLAIFSIMAVPLAVYGNRITGLYERVRDAGFGSFGK